MGKERVGARYVRTNDQRLRLVGNVCIHCDGKIFPPRDVCPKCGGEAKSQFAFSGKGIIYTYSVQPDDQTVKEGSSGETQSKDNQSVTIADTVQTRRG